MISEDAKYTSKHKVEFTPTHEAQGAQRDGTEQLQG